MTTSKAILDILDELGVDWGHVNTRVNLSLDPRTWKEGWEVSLVIECPVGYITAEKIQEAQLRLESLK